MTKISKRYFLFGWNDNDEWHDENNWELGLMITGLALHTAEDTSIHSIIRDWDSILVEYKSKILKEYQCLGIFEVENFRDHRDEFVIELDETTKLQYCRFKPRTSCVRLSKEVSINELDELKAWLNVFDIMSFNEYKDEYNKTKKIETKEEPVELMPDNIEKCDIKCKSSIYGDTPEDVRNAMIYVVFLLGVITIITLSFK